MPASLLPDTFKPSSPAVGRETTWAIPVGGVIVYIMSAASVCWTLKLASANRTYTVRRPDAVGLPFRVHALVVVGIGSHAGAPLKVWSLLTHICVASGFAVM